MVDMDACAWRAKLKRQQPNAKNVIRARNVPAPADGVSGVSRYTSTMTPSPCLRTEAIFRSGERAMDTKLWYTQSCRCNGSLVSSLVSIWCPNWVENKAKAANR